LAPPHVAAPIPGIVSRRRTMADTQSIILAILREHVPEIGKWLSKKPIRKAANAAMDLEFWPDGMLEELTFLAKGEGTKASFKKLEKKLKTTAGEVEEIIEGLKRSRSQISKLKDGEIVVTQINQIVFNQEVGKSAIRRDIESLVRTHKSTQAVNNDYVRSQSLLICNAMDAFNAGLHRLKRLVYDL
jgi:hypothetical protein